MQDESPSTPPRSPVPLSKEEAENVEVRKLAAKLAPAFEEAEALFEVPAEFQRQSSGVIESTFSEDDGMDRELENLELSEQLLRQELELAQDFSSLFNKKKEVDDSPIEEPETPETPQILATSSRSEADIGERDKDSPEQQEDSPTKSLPPIPIPSPKANEAPSTPQANKTKSVFVLVSPSRDSGVGPMPYTHSDHFEALHMAREERGGWYAVDMTRHVMQDNPRGVVGIKEYCLAIPEAKLKHLYVGMPESSNENQPLPVRTVAIRIRPDVLCGAVMDGVYQGLTSFVTDGAYQASTGLQARIRKRQGGHLRGVVVGAVVPSESETEPPTRYPPFLVDVQLCTYKSDDCDRMLLIRTYHVTEDEDDAAMEDFVTLQSESNVSNDEYKLVSHHTMLEDEFDTSASTHLRESCALVQRMEAPDLARKIRLSPGQTFDNRETVQNVVSEHLLEHYRACPSVKEGEITLPALNSEDWPVVQSSWRLVQAVWEELETRDLTYTTLLTSRFGAFPALPTLDVHYCSQIRRLSREGMIVQLLKRASDLEEYAREAEYACANLIALLQPTYEAYGVEAPSLPKPKPLTEYPLEFTAPQTSCPPWGVKVMEALNEVQAFTGDAGKNDQVFEPTALQTVDADQSFDMAQKAVHLVLTAFQKQDDEEQSARLERKNVQVMDRLAKMQSHQLASIQALQNCSNISVKAYKAAADFQAKTGFRVVPLLKWSIVVGGSTGTCSVTANHILFLKQRIPVIGGNKTSLFAIRDVEIAIEEATPSLLNPLPTVISLKENGEVVYSFRPSVGGARLKLFLDIVKKAAMETPLDQTV